MAATGALGALHCVVGSFDPKIEDITSYLERFQLFIEVNGISDADKVKYLLVNIGAECYKILKDLCLPNPPSKCQYTDLEKTLKQHYSPITLTSVERIKLRGRKQEAGESIANFILALKAAAKHCQFGTALDENLRDQFIFGLSDDRISRRLLCEQNLGFDKACQIALAMEVATVETGWMRGETSIGINMAEKGKKQFKPKPKTPTPNKTSNEQRPKCSRCGWSNHSEDRCRAASYKCHACGIIGHTKRMCRKKGRSDEGAERVHEVGLNDEDELLISNVAISSEAETRKMIIDLKVNDVSIQGEVDTGAAATLISRELWQQIGKPQLSEVKSVLKSVNSEVIQVLGSAVVNVNDHLRLTAIVVKSHLSYPLIGRPWLNVLFPNWKNNFILLVNKQVTIVEELKVKFPNCFATDDSPIRNFTASIVVKENSSPVFQRAYNVPFAIQNEVKDELLRLQSKGVIEPINHSDWASPIVCIRKPDNSIRICVDYKKTVNPVILKDVYMLPTCEELFSKLKGCSVFIVLDMKNAYQQLLLESNSQNYLVINTILGLFKVKKLPYGIATAPKIFQKVMDEILKGLVGVGAYQDDVIIVGKDENECKARAFAVFERLSKYNVKINEKKCQWLTKECTYLGHKLTSKGIEPLVEKSRAIADAPVPKDVTSLKAWLGLINFYHKYIPNAANVLGPLNELTQKGVKFEWNSKCQQSFNEAKKLLLNSKGLAYFDPSCEIIITTDCSGYGLGSVLSIVVQGEERPVFFHSATLSKAQKGYSVLEKEALSIVTAVKRYHKYICGRKFQLRTDHKALQYIFDPNRNVPSMTAAKLQRWAILLSAYEYKVMYTKGSEISNADGLSRNPLPDIVEDINQVSNLCCLNDLPLTSVQVKDFSVKDNELSQVLKALQYGWNPRAKENELRAYYLIRDELSIDEGILMRGHRVVIPKDLRNKVCDVLHEGHPGISRMKMLARSIVWWPGIDKQVENCVKDCMICHASRPSQRFQAKVVWPKPDKFFDRVHIDFCEKKGTKYLILVDSFSGWIECFIMKSTDAKAVINKLRTCFACLGLPRKIVTDNGPPFCSAELGSFFSKNGIELLHSPPFHSISNGRAERGVRTCKEMIMRESLENQLTDDQAKLDNILMYFRTTPKANGISPYEIVFKQKANTRLTLLRPQKRNCNDVPFIVPMYNIGDQVLVSTVGTSNSLKWVVGEVIGQESATTYWVQTSGRVRLTHVDFIKSGSDLKDVEDQSVQKTPLWDDIPTRGSTQKPLSPIKISMPSDHTLIEPVIDVNVKTPQPTSIVEHSKESQVHSPQQIVQSSLGDQAPVANPSIDRKSQCTPRRSMRTVKPPNRLDL